MRFYAHKCFSWGFLYSWTTNKTSRGLRVSLCAKSPGCCNFCNENLLRFLGPLRCSGILCVISPVYVGIIIYISPALSFVLNIRASLHCSGLQLWRFQQCRVGLFSYNSCTCKITGASWVVPVLLLWLKIQMTLIKNFSLLCMEPAGLLTSSAVLCEEDILCLIL